MSITTLASASVYLVYIKFCVTIHYLASFIQESSLTHIFITLFAAVKIVKNRVFQKATKLGVTNAAAVNLANRKKATAAVAANKFAANNAKAALAKKNALGLNTAVCIVETFL